MRHLGWQLRQNLILAWAEAWRWAGGQTSKKSTGCRKAGRRTVRLLGALFFFGLIMLAYSLSRLWRRTFYPYPVCCPRGGGTLQAPLCLLPGLSQEDVVRTEEITKEKQSCERGGQRKRQNRTQPVPYSSPTDALKAGVGRNSGSSSPAPNSSMAPSSSVSASLSSSRSRGSRLPFRRLASCALLSRHSPSHVLGGEEV